MFKMSVRAVFMAAMLCMASLTNAAVVVVNDGDQFNFNVADSYVFTGELSASNPILTYGVSVQTDEVMGWYVTAPVEFGLFTVLGTGPNFTGTGIITYGGLNFIPAGVTRSYPADGNYFVGQTQWLSIGVAAEGIAAIDTYFGGSFDVGSMLVGSTGFTYVPDDTGGGDTGGDTGGGGGDTGGGAGNNNVPEPGSLALFGLGLIGLGTISLKKKKS